MNTNGVFHNSYVSHNEEHHDDFLRAKIQIGNSKGPTSYKKTQTVFHHDDIPEARRTRKNEVRNWLKEDKLSVANPNWRKTTDPQVPVCERRQLENSDHDRGNAYKYNFRAESLDPNRMTQPVDVPTKFHVSMQLEDTVREILQTRNESRIQSGWINRTAELPSNPNLADHDQWALSTQFKLKDVDNRLDTITTHSKEWTKKVGDSLLTSKKYVGPMESTMLLQKEVRRQKAEGIFSLDKQINDPPIERVNRKALKNRFPNEKLNIHIDEKHSGVWEVNKVDGRSMWSDTASYQFHSPGDVRKRINKDAYNMEGPNLSNNKFRPADFAVTTTKV
jgi:hypothetical protein